MKQPEYMRGALFSSHAHYWDFHCGVAWVDGVQAVRSAVVWRKRRRVVRPCCRG